MDELPSVRYTLALLPLLLALSGCTGKNPGPLEGTWKASEPFPVTVTFRPGEAEAMGSVSRVSYKVRGQDVWVTYESGRRRGQSYRYTLTAPDVARSDSGVFRRVADDGKGR